MIRKDRKGKKTVHIDKNLHWVVDSFRSEKRLSSIEKAVDQLIKEGFKNLERKNELPDHIVNKFKSVTKENIPVDKGVKDTQLSDIPTDIIDKVKNEISSSNVGSKETIIEDTLRGIRYLRNEEEGKKRSDFLDNVFFDDSHPKSSWKVYKEGYKQLEGVLDQVEIDHNKGVYSWKG